MQGCPDQKSLFTFLDKVYYRKRVVLPAQLIASFKDFIVERITRIRKDPDEQVLHLPPYLPELHTDEAASSFAAFSPVSVPDVENVVSSPYGASCTQSSIPTWILKQCKHELLPTITNIVNRSLSSGKFSKSMKNALVKPLIKKSSLDPSEYKNYRPVSNLGFASKIIKGVVVNQLKLYIYANNLDDELKSAYRKKHMTETARLKVVSDIRSCIEQDQDVILILLDLSAAFDTVD